LASPEPTAQEQKAAATAASTATPASRATDGNAENSQAMAEEAAPKPPPTRGSGGMQMLSEPRVARVQMQLTKDEKIVDTIEKGDLLTIVEEREEGFVVRTFSGLIGAVEKVNAVKLAESVDIYNELIEATPDEGRLYTLRASAWWALQEREKALGDFDKAIALGYQAPHAFVSRGMFYAAGGKYKEAIEDYTRAIDIAGGDESALISRAAAYMNLQQFEQAIADYTEALGKTRGPGTILMQRALAYRAAGRLGEAIKDFDQAIELNAKDIPALMNRGFLHFQQQRHEQAIADFAAVIELNPKAAVALNNRGYNLQRLDRFTEALADYNAAIEAAPQYSLAYQNKAILLSNCPDATIQNPAEAVVVATKACELTEYKSVADMAALVTALEKDGQTEKAIGWQEKLLALLPEDRRTEAQKRLEALRGQGDQADQAPPTEVAEPKK
jgi:tetratricopeptide (TPR) repeat protein